MLLVAVRKLQLGTENTEICVRRQANVPVGEFEVADQICLECLTAETIKRQAKDKLRHETAKHRGQKGLLAVAAYGKSYFLNDGFRNGRTELGVAALNLA